VTLEDITRQKKKQAHNQKKPPPSFFLEKNQGIAKIAFEYRYFSTYAHISICQYWQMGTWAESLNEALSPLQMSLSFSGTHVTSFQQS